MNVGILEAENEEDRKRRNKNASIELTRDVVVLQDTLGSRDRIEWSALFRENFIMTWHQQILSKRRESTEEC